MGDLDSKNTFFTNEIQRLNIKNRDMHQSKWGNQQTMGISSGNNVRIGEKSRPRGPRTDIYHPIWGTLYFNLDTYCYRFGSYKSSANSAMMQECICLIYVLIDPVACLYTNAWILNACACMNMCEGGKQWWDFTSQYTSLQLLPTGLDWNSTGSTPTNRIKLYFLLRR